MSMTPKFNAYPRTAGALRPKAVVLARDWDRAEGIDLTSRALERHKARCGSDSDFDAGDINPRDFL